MTTAQPNVLLLTVDHWPASLFGCAATPHVLTPTLDELARSGIRFTNAYSECPVCIPARRSLMTGLSPRGHGDRTFQTERPMPPVPTLANTFRSAGYQAYAVGKLHVYPQRDRIGFDDVLLAEEGRPYYGVTDEYETFLGDRGFAGRQFDHGMSNNEYSVRTWHLPDDCHVTNWAARELSRTIRRRDPGRPSFWYLSFCHPHPPLTPLPFYWDLYRDAELPLPATGDWARDASVLPYRLLRQRDGWHGMSSDAVRIALRGFHALCTHIDHQIRIVIGTLREERLLDNTIIAFTSDHGDMLGTHGLWAKRLFYEGAANVPMVILGTAADERIAPGTVDDRLVGLQDVMPTLLELADVPIPESVEGQSMITPRRREFLYGECNEDAMATRMIHDGRYKLIYYPAGNCCQLFDLDEDPQELHNLCDIAKHRLKLEQLQAALIENLHGTDQAWIDRDRLIGCDAPAFRPAPNRGLSLQRGIHWPPPPVFPCR